MSTVIENKHLELLTKDYLPFQLLLELMRKESTMPYDSRFSFEPYMGTVSGKMGNACSHTKGLLTPLVKNASKYIESGENDIDDIVKSDHFKTMVSLVIPSMFFKDDVSFIAPPFKKQFLVTTPAFQELLNENKWEIKCDQEKILSNKSKSVSYAFIYILNHFYDQDIDIKNGEIITLRNKESGIERHFQITMKFDFISAKKLKPLPVLSQSQINKILSRIDDEEYVLKYLPADHFEFTGFSIGSLYDISEIEVTSQLKHWLSSGTNDLRPETFLKKLNYFLQSFLNESDILTGSIMTEHRDVHRNEVFSLTDHKDIDHMLIDERITETADVYGRMVSSGQTVLCEDLTVIKEPSYLEKGLLKNNIESIILYPITDSNGSVVSVLEIGSSKRNMFNDFVLKKLKPFYNIMDNGYEQYMQDINNRVTNIIQQKFTSIHPSVEWKFQDVALKYLSDKIYEEGSVDFDPIVFQDVYPLYAQSDIVSSTLQRNKAIQEDLIENLEALSDLMEKWFKKSKIHLLESYHLKVDKLLVELKKKFVSNDETKIVNLLINEIHPLLKRLEKRHSNLPKKIYQKYTALLDPELNIVYKKRKAFETSVNQLNMAISDYLEKENESLQKHLPHFFEKYKTDGIEYNMYLGQSILKQGGFNDDDLRNFRLWQLVNSCEIVRLVDQVSPQLEVHLKTASLIFVYNQSLSIRFRMDEKQFDVDGAYNVRYEILKKRIDKALIKGTKERLTVSGKIAIVYLSDKEKAEYIEFFEYLIEKGYIDENYEDLELDKLQGAEGLKALRITVKV